MNTIEPYITITPSGEDEQCAHFIIDDASMPFVLKGVMREGREYAFSFWAKSDSDGKISVKNNTFETTAEWKKHSAVFNSTGTDLEIYFDVGTYYIYHPQLEIGNKVTDWTPAPEDIENELSETETGIRETISTQSTEILSTCSQIVFTALESYVETGDYEEFRNTVETQFSILSDEITASFTRATQEITNVNGDLQEYKKEQATSIRLSYDGVTIGRLEDGIEAPYMVVLNNEKLSFQYMGNEVAYIQYNKLYIRSAEIMERISIGSAENGGFFDWITTETGMGLKWRDA